MAMRHDLRHEDIFFQDLVMKAGIGCIETSKKCMSFLRSIWNQVFESVQSTPLTSCKWSYNPYKWPYIHGINWGYFTLVKRGPHNSIYNDPRVSLFRWLKPFQNPSTQLWAITPLKFNPRNLRLEGHGSSVIPVGKQSFSGSMLKFGGVIVVNIPLMKNGFSTLLRTNISPIKALLKMIFLFPRWDMLVSILMENGFSILISHNISWNIHNYLWGLSTNIELY